MNGIVRSFNAHRGFGFIHCLIGKPDSTAPLFFHATSCMPPGCVPPVGALVSFHVVRADRGRQQAARVVLVTEPLKDRQLSGTALLRRAATRQTE